VKKATELSKQAGQRRCEDKQSNGVVKGSAARKLPEKVKGKQETKRRCEGKQSNGGVKENRATKLVHESRVMRLSKNAELRNYQRKQSKEAVWESKPLSS
jgi:hypothetical protein